jgi:hypothetical protein
MDDPDISKLADFFDGLSEASRAFYHPYPFDQSAIALTAKELHDEGCAHIGAFHGEQLVGHVWYRSIGTDNYPTVGIGVVDAFHDRGIGKKTDARHRRTGSRPPQTGAPVDLLS